MAKSEPLVKRPSWDEYFMQMAELTAQRSTCLRRHVGAVIVQDKHVVATGYNGAPKGVAHCAELGGCLREKMGIPSGRSTRNRMRSFRRRHWPRASKAPASTSPISPASSAPR